SAQAYPTPVLTLNLNLQTVVSNHQFKAVASADIKCDTLTVTFLNQTATSPGSTVTKVFTAPTVTKTTTLPVHGTCTFTSTTGTSGHALAVKSQTLRATAYITITPVGGGTGLPNTGGPSVGWLVAGVAALIAGAGAMFFGRRRSSGIASH
ncbi:MAG TPA: LPXTG cell wall anchor domain-containing protein, partial [Marmoricola sp.]|nr:LPXTG cell wall anchor domain-containing protein [Marmoricola sp.]